MNEQRLEESEKYKFIKATGKKEKIVSIQERKGLVNKVSCALAVRAIDFWIEGGGYPIELSEALNHLTRIEANEEELGYISFLKKTGNKRIADIVKELEFKLEDKYKKHPLDIENAESRAEFLCYCCSYAKKWYETDTWASNVNFISGACQLNMNWQELSNEVSKKLEEIVFPRDKGGIKPTLEFYRELGDLASLMEQECQKKRQKCYDKESGFKNSYKLNEGRLISSNSEFNKREAIEYAKNALYQMYRWKIEGEAYSMAAQVWVNTRLNLERYSQGIRKNEVFLRNLRNSIDRGNPRSRDFALLSEAKIDYSDLKRKIEKKIGCRAPNWGVFGEITEQMVGKAMLSVLEPMAREICWELHGQLQKEFGKSVEEG